MGMIDREYMHERHRNKSRATPSVEKLLTQVKPARLVSAHRQWLFLCLGLGTGSFLGYYFNGQIGYYLSIVN